MEMQRKGLEEKEKNSKQRIKFGVAVEYQI